MKNTILIMGIVLTSLNTLIGAFLNGYLNFNMIFADVSILISTLLLYLLMRSSMKEGYKIGLGFIFILLGIARYICAITASNEFENNLALILFICLITFEVMAVFVAQKLSTK